MISLVLPKPQEKQIQFMRATKKHIAFGGSRGG